MTSQVPEYGGCPWPMDPACQNAEWATFDPDVQERALALASMTLERLTGFRVGNCPVKVRPCAQPGVPVSSWPGDHHPAGPLNWAGSWSNSPCASGDCTTTCEVILPAPVGRIDEVMLDGLPITTWELHDTNILVYTGAGECRFPMSQDLSLPDTELGTFSVTYLNAYPVDSNGAYAVGLLAIEFAKACAGSSKCRLPSGVTNLVRNGVSITITPGTFPGGVTGIREVDAFIMAWNPNHLTGAPTVWSPDQPGVRQVTLRGGA